MFMKKSLNRCFAAVTVIFIMSITAQADIIKLAEVGVDPSAVVGIKGVVNASVLAGQYKLKAEDATIIDAFCVDPQYSTPNKFFDYEMVDVSGKYTKAAWLWENMSILGNDAVATQIAIWEVTWENDNTTVNLGSGNFILNSASTATRTNALSMLSALESADLSSFSADGYRVVVSDKTQDYLVRHSVPEPGSTLLMFMGIVCVGLVGFRKKNT